jgi:hypothetical protein
MPDYAGPLQRLVLSRTLWLVAVWPMVGFAWQALFIRRRMTRARGQGAMKHALTSARNAGTACVALATASTLAHAVVLAHAPQGTRALFEHVARGARFGQLDGEVDLLFDPLSATFCTLACLVALATSAFVATAPPPSRGWRSWAWIQLSLAGALVTFLADGFVGTAIGWALTGAAGAWLAGWSDARKGVVAAVRNALSLTAMLLGASLLFWGLGGSWDGDEYLPDLLPRFTVARATGSIDDNAARDVGGTITFTALPGALVFLDDARTPSMRSPFVQAPVLGGSHGIRVRAGEGSNEDVLGRVVFDGSTRDVDLVALGPGLTFRAIADQLVLRDREGDTSLRSQLEARSGPGGTAVVAASLVALLLAAGLMSGAAPSGDAPATLRALGCAATTAAVGPYLLARLAFLFALAPNTWMAVESVGAVILLVAGWRAPPSGGIRRWLAFVGVAPAALSFLALGAGGVTTAAYVMILSGVATAALYLAAARRIGLDPATGARDSIEELLFVRTPMRLGSLLVSMDRWVVDAIAGTIATLARASAWTVAMVDEHWVAAPANVAASRVVRFGRSFEPALGVPLHAVIWALLAAVAVAAFGNALWPGR